MPQVPLLFSGYAMEEEIYFGSLFAGIGGIDLGLERAGMVCRWQVESDPFCNRVLDRHWPDVRRYGDVKETDPGKVEEECGRVRLVAGGFPCQDLSFAGKRRGIHAERSGLWFEFERFVRDLRPEVVLVENVPGLLSGGLDVVLGCLAALGYDAEWDCVPAAVFGAPHLRHRVFVVAYIKGNGQPAGNRSQGGNGLYPRFKEKFVLRNDGRGFKGVWPVEAGPRLVRVADGLPAELDEGREGLIQAYQKRQKRMVEDRVSALGNAVVPQVAEWIGRRIMEMWNGTD